MRLYGILRSPVVARHLRAGFKKIAYCVPPFVTDAVRYALPDWEYMPRGWSQEDPRVKGWDDDSVANAQEKHWPALVRNLQGPGPLGVSHFPTSVARDDGGDHNTMMSYGYVLALASRKSLTMLDWGGGLGHYYLYSRALLPELKIEYHCHDVPRLCRLGRKLLPEAQFHESAADLFARQYDLVVSSSSLHYFEDWQEIVRKLASATGQLLYIARLQTVSRRPSFVVVQRPYYCGYYTQYLSWSLNRQEVLACAEQSGLELVREFVFAEESVVRGAPEKGESRGFLFRRRG